MLVAVLCLYVCNEFCFLQLHYNEKDLYYKENRRHIKKNQYLYHVYVLYSFISTNVPEFSQGMSD